MAHTLGPLAMLLDHLNPWYRPPSEFDPASLASLSFQAPVKLLLHHIYQFLSHLHSTPRPLHPLPIRVVCLSDTHSQIPDNVPDGDVLIHAGDMTHDGSVAEIQKQIDWLSALPHKEVVVIAGNHDSFLDPRVRASLPEEQRRGTLNWKRVHYLQHRRVSLTIKAQPVHSDDAASAAAAATATATAAIHGNTPLLAADPCQRRIRIYGAPQIPACGPRNVHAFQYKRGQDAWSETVPEDIDILVTHTPPKFYRDLPLPMGLGCEHLLAEVQRVKPALHVFGHVHWGAGQTVVWWDKAQDAYVQGLSIHSKWTRGLLNPILWLNVLRVIYRGLRELLWDRVWGGQSPSTIMVNAAQMHGNTGRLANSIQVVDM